MAEHMTGGPVDGVPLLDLDTPPPAPAPDGRRRGRRALAVTAAVAFAAGIGVAELVEHQAAETRDAAALQVVVLPSGQWTYQAPQHGGSPAPGTPAAPDRVDGLVTVRLVNAGPRPLVLNALTASGPGYEIVARNRQLQLPPLGAVEVPAVFSLRCDSRSFPTEVTLTLALRTADGERRNLERPLAVGGEPADAAQWICRDSRLPGA